MELPRIEPILRKYRDRGFEIIALDSHRDKERGIKFIKDKELTGLFLQNGEGTEEYIYRVFGVQGFPTTYLIDRSGRVMYLHYGFKEGMEVQIEEHVERLIAQPAQ